MGIICGPRFIANLTIITFAVGLAVGVYLTFHTGFTFQECTASPELAVGPHG